MLKTNNYTIRWSTIILFILSYAMASAQSFASTNDKTLTAFTNVFFEAKKLKPDWNKIGEQMLDSLGISKEEYSAIVSNRNDESQRSNNRQIITSNFAKEEARQDQLQQENLMTLCKKFGISFSKYEELLALYRKDISFQQTLLPYFSTYMENLAK